MGDKAEAKRRMLAVGVPCALGYFCELQSDEQRAANRNGLACPCW